MNILYVGGLPWHRPSSTGLNRYYAIKKVVGNVDYVNTLVVDSITIFQRVVNKLFVIGFPFNAIERFNENAQILFLVDKNNYDIVWIDKGLTISAKTLEYIKQKQPNCKIVSFSPDNMALRHNQSQQYLDCIPLYDVHFTTKSFIIDDLKQLGAKNVFFVQKAYSEKFHYPRELVEGDVERLGGDVGFIGAWEKERCESVCYLADNGIKVRVWGDGKWNEYKNYSKNLIIEGQGLWNEDYSKSFKAFKISLCFLRKINNDQQTARTMEIPASGGFMLAERTDEHRALFEEDKEAVFFSSNEELLEKCRYYLAHDAEREAIAKAGRQRCIDSDYSNEGMVRRCIKMVMGDE